MAALATTEPWLASFLETLAARHRRPDRGPRARHRPAHHDRRPAPRRTTSPAPPRRPRPPSRPGPPRATRSGPRVLRRAAEIYEANRDEFGTWTQRETGRLAQQDAPRVELRVPRDPQRRDAAVAAVRLAHAVGGEGPALDGPAGAGRGHRRDHAVELAVACWACASSRPALALGQRGRPQAGPADPGRRRRDVRGGLPRGRAARGPAPGRRRRRGRRRGARHRPQHPGRVVHRVDGRRAAGRPAGRRHAQEGLAGARRQQRVHRPRRRGPGCRRRRRAPSRRSSSRARSASRPVATSSSAASPTRTSRP